MCTEHRGGGFCLSSCFADEDSEVGEKGVGGGFKDARASAAQQPGKDIGLGVGTPDLLPPGCVTLGRSLHTSETPFLRCQCWELGWASIASVI